MDNNQTWQINSKKPAQMENWKKQILMDPVLNGLFDPAMTAQQFFNMKIASLPHHQVPSLFSKLSSISFELIQSLQKEVENKSDLIQKSFYELLAYKQEIQQKTQATAADSRSSEHLSHLRAFNRKYESVEQSLLLWKNISDCLHFSKAFQSFKVTTNIMKSRMRGYNGNEDTINPFNIAKFLKQIIYLSSEHDFSGMKGFENERVFISSTKSIIHGIGCKALPRLLLQLVGLLDEEKATKQKLQSNIEDWITALSNIGTLREFVINYGKSLMRDVPESIKKNIKSDAGNLSSNVENILGPYLYESCKAIIVLQQKLITARKVEMSNVPNLFTCIWEKLCTSMKENISFIRNQESRVPPKTREQSIVWKYPALYATFAKLCSNIQSFLIENAAFNCYSFGKSKEKLMVSSLLELALQYHLEKDRLISEILKPLSTNGRLDPKPEDLEEAKLDKQEQELCKPIQQSIGQLDWLLRESKCELIFNSVLNCLCQKIHRLNEEAVSAKGGGEERQEQPSIKALSRLKKQIKSMVRKHGEWYGIDKNQLQSFRISF